MTKKLSAIILSIVMIFSFMSVAVSAADSRIAPLTPVTVTASAENNPVLKFTPEETKTYKLVSYAPDDVDPYCNVQTADSFMLIDDSEFSTNFAQKIEFEAGVEYTITIFTYNEDLSTFDIALECCHEWDDDTCYDCGKVCDHNTENSVLQMCECGKVSTAETIETGDTVTSPITNGAPVVVKFEPGTDITAIVYSSIFNEETMYDVRCTIYDSENNVIADNDDFGSTMDFVIFYEFTAGETYYIVVETNYDDVEVVFSLTEAAHTVDGAKHSFVYTDYYEGTCQEFCYTPGIYCPECDEYLFGHNEDGNGYCCDDDWDGICDACGESMDDSDEDDAFDDIIEDDSIFAKILSMIKYFINLVINFFKSFM